jgi:curli biogenesis system outer membrane secretion channel CsgG
MKRNTTIMALATIATLAAFGTASAATEATPMATQATCDALVKQADNALTTHKSDSKAKAAHEQRDKGEKECKAGNYAKGAEHLRHAITDLGMKPVD